MSAFMVMTPPPSDDAERDATKVVFVKEGFCWPAFFFAVPWLLFRGLWLVLVGYLVLAILVAGAGELIGGVAPFVAGFAFSLLFSLEANGLRRWTLERRGWRMAGVVAGANRDECEIRFFSAWKGPEPAAPAAGRFTPPAADGRKAPPARVPTPSDEVIGLFPEATR
ncbi:DUF2628 domain-containing protein [Breoghania sp. JC706]|uniref:DUF2628 domain-containing protein n=1 Tax=Breoghania sp. JC706 TaxID=3117732 RepID=UPI003009041E